MVRQVAVMGKALVAFVAEAVQFHMAIPVHRHDVFMVPPPALFRVAGERVVHYG